MNVLSVLKPIAFSTLLLIFFSCDNSEVKSIDETHQALTFESIEKGTSIDEARKQLAAKFEEHQVGQQPNLVVFALEDGQQLVFTDGELTDKNTAEELDQIVGESAKSKQ